MFVPKYNSELPTVLISSFTGLPRISSERGNIEVDKLVYSAYNSIRNRAYLLTSGTPKEVYREIEYNVIGCSLRHLPWWVYDDVHRQGGVRSPS
ncbi:MAG: hypothetical protein BMS9Abin13_644 [Patescibacteria group bacterium]|nr:MAG: hypothetical protein BMS9Abin13_644 [Patescibacteria group bacterium]